MKKLISQIILLLFAVILILSFFLYRNLSKNIDRTLEQGWFEPSIEYYSAPVVLKNNKNYSYSDLKKNLIQRNYIPQTQFHKLKPGEFILLTEKDCKKYFDHSFHFEICLGWIQKTLPHQKNLAGFKQNMIHLFEGQPLSSVDAIQLDPVLFAQYEEFSPHIRKRFKLNEVPYLCLQSITITEDQNFLIHKGASPSAIVRALIKNIKNIRIKEGGSTITQQLIKNRFLSSEKTFKRKWVEFIMSIILERKISKDQILELYLNTVYMGQSGPYSLFGFSSAAEHYLNTPISRLNASQCALLSAIVQSPGRWNPFLHPKKAKQRRDFILKKMNKNKVISSASLKKAINFPLPVKAKKIQVQKAPYFIQAVQKKLQAMAIDLNRHLKIYTTINLEFQKKAVQAVEKTLLNLEKKQKHNKPLQVSLICLDLKTNQILALIGGKNFFQSQFNRAVQSYRPIGSLVKPFVYLSALIHLPQLNPLSIVQDEPMKTSSWSPKNYKNKYYGSVPLYFSIKESLNTVSAKLGQKTGLEKIIKDFSNLGYEKKADKLPSITLGSVEMSIFEVSQMYSTIARMGSYLPLSSILKISLPSEKVLYQNLKKEEQRFSKQKTAVLIGMMKQVIESGTAGWIRPFWPYISAGKTGTSNDERDSWFVGFTPRYLTAVWIGYDDNTSHSLTGASGALPLWFQFMRSLPLEESADFHWPKGVKKDNVHSLTVTPVHSSNKDIHLFSVSSSSSSPENVQLIFEEKKEKKWYEWFF